MIRILASTFVFLLSFSSYATMAPGFEQDSGVGRLKQNTRDNQVDTDAESSFDDSERMNRQAEEENDRSFLREKDSLRNEIKSNKEP